MGKFLIKPYKKKDIILEWSTITDTPTSLFTGTREEIINRIKADGYDNFSIELLFIKGHSYGFRGDIKNLLRINRVGENEETLKSWKKIIKKSFNLDIKNLTLKPKNIK